MDLLGAMRISASGLTAQRTKMNVVAENIANVDTTRTPEGGPYRRKMVVFGTTPVKDDFGKKLEEAGLKHTGVEVKQIVKSQEDFRLVYNPSHPDADPVTGYVAMPNVDHITEISDMMVARRAYDANVSALNNSKSMILKALEIGK